MPSGPVECPWGWKWRGPTSIAINPKRGRPSRMRVPPLLGLIAAPSIAAATLVAPTSLVAAAASGTTISLTWADSNTTETGFSVERGLDGVNFAVIGSTGINVTSYLSSGLSSGVRYYYRV